jgi:hypothetical protein
MKAAMSIIVELLEPALVRSTDDLKQLDLAQVKQVAIKVNAANQSSGEEPLYLESRSDQQSGAILTLLEFAETIQPEGTCVEVWFQGRSEEFWLDSRQIAH